MDAEFELFVIHIESFIFDGILTGGVGQMLSNPKKKGEYVLNANPRKMKETIKWAADRAAATMEKSD